MNFKTLMIAFSLCLMPVCAHAELSFLNATKEQRAFFKKDLELQVQEIELQLYSEFGEGVLEFLDHLAYDVKVVSKAAAVAALPLFLLNHQSHPNSNDINTVFKFAAGFWFMSLVFNIKEGKLEKQKELKEKLKQIKASLREISVLDAAEEQNAVAYNK